MFGNGIAGQRKLSLFNDRRGIMPKRKKVVKLQERPRNLLTLAPIMQKGGAHGKSDKALRRAERQQMQMSAREAFSSREDVPLAA